MRERRVVVPPKVLEVVRRLAPARKRKVHAALRELARDPHLGEPLQRELAGMWRVRVGEVRVMYRFSTGVIQVVAIGPRRTIYAELERETRRS